MLGFVIHIKLNRFYNLKVKENKIFWMRLLRPNQGTLEREL